MRFSFLSQFSSYTIATALFLAMLVVLFLICPWITRFRDDETREGFAPVQSSLLGLLALLLAFTFAMSAARYDARRHVLIEEANTITTALHRADLYPENERKQLKAYFKDYIDARLTFHDAGMSSKDLEETTSRSTDISDKIWAIAVSSANGPDPFVRSSQMIPALNNMIDVVTTRNATRQATVPDSIVLMLLALCIMGSVIVGSGKPRPGRLACVTFALMISSCVFLIVDLDRPAGGSITLDDVHQHMERLRATVANEH